MELFLEPDSLESLIALLRERGYSVVGPTLRDGAIIYDEITSAAELPVGWTDEQQPGIYRIKRRDDDARFGYAVGPHSWKKFLHPPELRLWSAVKAEDGTIGKIDDESAPVRYAFLGVRSCDLHAIEIQDRVFVRGPYVDRHYAEHRERAFIVAVNCGQAGGTCFCASMATGPRCSGGFDICLTEISLEGRRGFLAETGSDPGREVLSHLETRSSYAAERAAAEESIERARSSMGRHMETDGIKELLYRNLEHPRWDDVSERCLSCTNCTMVCPTCFCHSVEDTTDLTGRKTERTRRWDSCFTVDFSYIHGGSVRKSIRTRYRQWLTHKVATWIDQFGVSGCVGCGRCITWCPVGIDITEEVNAIRQSDGATKSRADENPD